MHYLNYTFAINEKTAVDPKPLMKIQGFSIHRGCIFEPVADFANKTFTYQPAKTRFYYKDNDRYKRLDLRKGTRNLHEHLKQIRIRKSVSQF